MGIATRADRATGDARFQLVATGPGSLSVQGPLNFASARRACELGIEALAQASGSKLEIDCGGVTVSDSAGLAVLLEWLSVAQRAGRSLRYTQLPEGLLALARISEADPLLERGV
jgi:phospholipid transport system transporter-binding protein